MNGHYLGWWKRAHKPGPSLSQKSSHRPFSAGISICALCHSTSSHVLALTALLGLSVPSSSRSTLQFGAGKPPIASPQLTLLCTCGCSELQASYKTSCRGMQLNGLLMNMACKPHSTHKSVLFIFRWLLSLARMLRSLLPLYCHMLSVWESHGHGTEIRAIGSNELPLERVLYDEFLGFYCNSILKHHTTTKDNTDHGLQANTYISIRIYSIYIVCIYTITLQVFSLTVTLFNANNSRIWS